MIFTNSHLYWDHIANYLAINRPSKVYITTFNLWTAISNWPDPKSLPYKMEPIQKVMTYMNNKSVDGRIIMGVISEPFIKDYQAIKEKWPSVRIRYLETNHSKFLVAQSGDKWEAWVGSCNANNSSKTDVATNCPHGEELHNLFRKMWQEAEPIRAAAHSYCQITR